MLGKNFSLLFYLKKPKNYQSGAMPIYLRLTIDSGVRKLTTSRSCEPTRWNKVSGRAIGKKEETKLLNAYLDTLQTKVYEARRQLIESNRPVTADGLKNILTGKGERPRLILEIFQQHNVQRLLVRSIQLPRWSAIVHRLNIPARLSIGNTAPLTGISNNWTMNLFRAMPSSSKVSASAIITPP